MARGSLVRWMGGAARSVIRGTRVEEFLDPEDSEPSKNRRRAASAARAAAPRKASVGVEQLPEPEDSEPSKHRRRAASVAHTVAPWRESVWDLEVKEFLDPENSEPSKQKRPAAALAAAARARSGSAAAGRRPKWAVDAIYGVVAACAEGSAESLGVVPGAPCAAFKLHPGCADL